MGEKLILIDGHSILNRAFYGVPDLIMQKAYIPMPCMAF